MIGEKIDGTRRGVAQAIIEERNAAFSRTGADDQPDQRRAEAAVRGGLYGSTCSIGWRKKPEIESLRGGYNVKKTCQCHR